MSTPGGYGPNSPDGDNSGDKGGQSPYGEHGQTSGYGSGAEAGQPGGYPDPSGSQPPQYGAQTTGPGNQAYPQQTGYGTAGQLATKTNGLAIASLICGILSILSFCVWFVSIPLAIAAIVTGVLGNKKAKLGQARQGGLAKGGLITGIIGLVLAVVLLVVFLALGSRVAECEGLTGTAQQECVTRVITGG